MSTLLALPLLFSAALAADGDVARVAVVVGANNGPGAERPDLHYADDDAIRFAAFFEMLGARTHLVTRPDEESHERAAQAALRPPTLDGVREAVSAAADEVAAARAAGRRAELYFVFAGHGSVDAGRGFLELEDARLGSAELKALIDRVGADRTHVVLDACNAFFVVYPRRPGGRIVATTADVTAGIVPARGDLAVMLSTSAEADVFEWSQLEGGIFSHVLRSGSTGAADADDDGTVSYRELEAFVGVAVSTLPHGPYRPRVFVRAPDGATFADLRSAKGARVQLGVDDRRVTVRDQRGTRIVDLHRVPERARELRLPAGASYTLASERGMRELKLGLVDGGVVDVSGPVERENEARVAMRGSDATLERLFAKPFSPENIALFHEEKAAAGDAVVGLSSDAERRLATLVGSRAAEARDARLWGAAGTTALTAVGVLSIAPFLSYSQDPRDQLIVAGGMATVAGLGALLSVPSFFIPSRIETVSAVLNADDSPETRGRRVGHALLELDQMAARSELDRQLGGAVAVGVGALAAGIGAASMLNVGGFASIPPGPQQQMRPLIDTVWLTTGATLLFTGIESFFVPSPDERFLELVRTDRELVELQPPPPPLPSVSE